MNVRPIVLAVAVIASISSSIVAELTLLGPTLTPFGAWQDWQECPTGTFVTGVDVRTKKYIAESRRRSSSSTRYDEAGLISVVLQCEEPLNRVGQPNFIYTIVPGVESSVSPGKNADNSTKLRKNSSETKTKAAELVVYELPLRNLCKGVATGYQMMIQPEQVAVDNAAAVNLRLYCSELKHHVTNQFLEAYGDYKGEWTDEQLCRNRQAVCGVQARAEIVDQDDYDNTGINNIRLKCCDLPNPATICTPLDEWQLIQHCDTVYSDVDLPCSYVRSVGVSTTKTQDFSDKYDFNENNGFTLSSENGEEPFWLQNGLAETFTTRFNQSSSTTGYDWSKAGDETFDELTSEIVEFNLGIRKKASIFQTVGKCSYFVARTARFKIETESFDELGVKNSTKEVKYV